MRKLIGFFAGLVILMLVLALVGVAMRIYNYAAASRIDVVLMQPANLHQNRVKPPVALADAPDDDIRARLIETFAKKYLEVLPDEDELSAREDGTLGMMSAPKVIAEWTRGVLPEMEKMAAEKKFRTIDVDIGGILAKDAYLIVPFGVKVWDKANDLNAAPVVSGGKSLYLKLEFNKKVRDVLKGREFDAGKFLDAGNSAPVIFEFRVDDAFVK